jgi:hypothetical protein
MDAGLRMIFGFRIEGSVENSGRGRNMRLLKGICKLSNHMRYAYGTFIKLPKDSTSHIQTCEVVEQINIILVFSRDFPMHLLAQSKAQQDHVQEPLKSGEAVI